MRKLTIQIVSMAFCCHRVHENFSWCNVIKQIKQPSPFSMISFRYRSRKDVPQQVASTVLLTVPEYRAAVVCGKTG